MASAYTGSLLMPPVFGVIAGNVSAALLPAVLGIIALLMILMCEKLNKTEK